jgi:excisionase family DNA binding protein
MNNSDKHEIVSEGLQSVSATARFLGVSRSFIYKLIRSGDLPSVKLGSSRRVPIKAVRELASGRLVMNPPNEKAADGGRRLSGY